MSSQSVLKTYIVNMIKNNQYDYSKSNKELFNRHIIKYVSDRVFNKIVDGTIIRMNNYSLSNYLKIQDFTHEKMSY